MSQFVSVDNMGRGFHYLDYQGTRRRAEVLVTRFAGTWGYTIWAIDANSTKAPELLGGAKDWDWTLDEAKDAALGAVREACGATAEERAG